MMSFLNLLSVELIKTKKTFALWLTVLGACFIPGFMIMIYLQQGNLMIPKAGDNPWTEFFQISWNGMAFLFIQFFVVLLTCLMLNIEHKNNGWRQLFILPVSKTMIFLIKYLTIVIFILVFLILYSVFLSLTGLLLGLINPELKLLQSVPNISQFLFILLKSFISLLGLFSIHFFLSVKIKNMIIPIAVAVIGIILYIAIFQARRYTIIYLPYAFNYLSVNPPDFLNYPTLMKIAKHEYVSLGYFLAISVCSYYYFVKKFRG